MSEVALSVSLKPWKVRKPSPRIVWSTKMSLNLSVVISPADHWETRKMRKRMIMRVTLRTSHTNRRMKRTPTSHILSSLRVSTIRQCLSNRKWVARITRLIFLMKTRWCTTINTLSWDKIFRKTFTQSAQTRRPKMRWWSMPSNSSRSWVLSSISQRLIWASNQAPLTLIRRPTLSERIASLARV